MRNYIFRCFFGKFLLLFSVIFLATVLFYRSQQRLLTRPDPHVPTSHETPQNEHRPRDEGQALRISKPPLTPEERVDLARLHTIIKRRADELPNQYHPPTSAFQETMIELRTGRITWQQALEDINPEVPKKEQTQ